jgi:hypothetical protein
MVFPPAVMGVLTQRAREEKDRPPAHKQVGVPGDSEYYRNQKGGARGVLDCQISPVIRAEILPASWGRLP